MGFLLIILILFLLYMNKELFGGHSGAKSSLRNKYYYESFSEESYPIGEGNYFNPNSRSNDYFYDRTGMKGSIYIDISDEITNTNNTNNNTNNNIKLVNPVMSQIDVLYKLELYPKDIYTRFI